MNCSAFRACLLVAASFLPALFAHAQTDTPPPTQQGPPLQLVITADGMMTMQGNTLLAKTTKHGTSIYRYQKGRLTRISRSDGSFVRYHYVDGKLDHIAYSTGAVHKPVYDRGILSMLESSSGKKLGLHAGAKAVDKSVAGRRTGQAGTLGTLGSVAAALAPPSPAQATALNKMLIAIENWETAGWECSVTPEGEQICIGRPDKDDREDEVDDYERPVIDMPETPPPGGEEPNGSGSDGWEFLRRDLDTRESCLAAAEYTWLVMRYQFCPLVRNQETCLKQNYRLYEDLKANCRATFP
jgi:hypothetical protein